MRRIFCLAVACLLPTALARSAEHAYVGSKSCKKCHLKQHRSWAKTKMAQAFESLRPGVGVEAKTQAGVDPDKDYTQDPECLSCHTTGYGKQGGFVDEASTPELTGVGCEACHGPGGTYTQPEYMSLKNKEYKLADLVAVGLVEKVSAEQCVSCHDTASPFVAEFDFEARQDEGTHEHYPLKYQHD
jgi:hypothetical protein